MTQTKITFIVFGLRKLQKTFILKQILNIFIIWSNMVIKLNKIHVIPTEYCDVILCLDNKCVCYLLKIAIEENIPCFHLYVIQRFTCLDIKDEWRSSYTLELVHMYARARVCVCSDQLWKKVTTTKYIKTKLSIKVTRSTKLQHQ